MSILSNDERKNNRIIDNFNSEVSLLCKFCIIRDKDNIDLIWIDKAVRTLKYENPKFIIELCLDKIWDNKEKIIERDEQFFKNNNIEDKYIENEKNKEWLSGLINVLRHFLFNLNADDKDFIWERFNIMLELVIEYRIVKKYFR
jgi:hypothetical protein